MDDGTPTLEVGFAIDTEGSFETLRQLQAAMDTTEGRIVAEAAKIERATSGMMNLSGPRAEITAFGNAYTREMDNLTKSRARAESAAEGMIRQLDREAMFAGKTRAEIRELKVEQRALAAESVGYTEVAARLRAAQAEVVRVESATRNLGATAARSRGSMMQFGMQMNDVATMAALGAPAFQIFASQIGQIVQVAQMAEGGVKGFARELGALAIAYAPLIAIAGVAVAGLALFQRSVSDGIDTTAMVNGLGLTRSEIKKLENTSVTTGDVMKATFQVLVERVGINLGDLRNNFASAMDFLTKAGRVTLSALYAQFVGTFRAIGAIVNGVMSGKGIGAILSDVGGAYKNSFNEADKALIQFGKDVNKRIGDNKLADLQKQAAAIKADRTPKADPKPRSTGESLAEKLAREARAIEAQIRNLYALAEAYGVSGAAALIAEARVKAETEAIKKRGEVEVFVDRQIRLAIAQRVSDAAKSTAAMRDQAEAQRMVNEQVALGLIPASRAAEIVKDQLADLPLLAAVQAAQERGLTNEVQKATAALEEQRRVRVQLRASEEQARFDSDMAGGEKRLAMIREEMRLVGATNAERTITLAVLRATQEAEDKYDDPAKRQQYIEQQRAIAVETQLVADATRDWNDQLSFTADRLDLIAQNVSVAAGGMADAFGDVGRAIGDMAGIFADFAATRERLDLEHQQRLKEGANAERENAKYALRTATLEVGAFGDMTAAAKGFFDEKSKGYKAIAAAEKAFRAIEFALSVRAMAQDIKETGLKILNSGAKAAASAVEAIAKAIASLPFPANLVAGAATAAALVAIGVQVAGAFGGGGKNTLEKANDGTGTVLGDADAKSESIKNAINALKDVDTVTATFARQMAGSLRSIDSQIGNLATVLVRAGAINASQGVSTGFKPDMIGSILGSIPLIGGLLGGLFGSKTTVIGSGLYGGAQSLGDILSGGFDAQTYSDIKKKKKFFGVTTSTKYRTQYGEVDPALENQFTLILKSFNDAILAAAGPLGASTSAIEATLSGFVVNLGKIDLQGLTGAEIEEKLQAVFGAAADNMALAAFPGMEKFQQVGEGAFETLVRVAATVEAVTNSLDMLGNAAANLGIEAKVGLADYFDNVGEFTSAIGTYFDTFYTKEEQVAAKTEQMTRALQGLNLGMPTTLAGFRALVDAQDLTTEAGRATYASLLRLAPAFADLQQAMDNARSAADIASERQGLLRQLYQVQGNVAAIRAMDLAKLDISNRALQAQIWFLQDAKEAQQAAEELRKAWQSVGDTILDEVNRIRGLTQAGSGNSFATLMGQFNAATLAARAGDMEAAKQLPQLSQAMLTAAGLVATSRQELDRVRAETATSLEITNAQIAAFIAGVDTSATDEAILSAAASAQQAASSASAETTDELRLALADLKAEIAGMRGENTTGLATIAGSTTRIARTLDNVTSASGGDAISTVQAA